MCHEPSLCFQLQEAFRSRQRIQTRRNEILWEKNNYNAKYTAWGSWKSPSNPYLKYTWKGYCDEVDRNLRKVYSRQLEKSPPSLDLAPYLYCRDREALKEIRDSEE